MGQEEEEEECGKVNREGSHVIPESGGASGSVGEMLGQRTLLEEQWSVIDLQYI